MRNRIGFFVIGAQKAGTTALHNLLRQHPRISLPINKEAPFFSRNEYFEKGIDWYLNEFYEQRDDDHVKGSVTPQYMSYPEVPKRLYNHCPDVKLIAILRDPIERMKSHYKMRVRAFGETQTLSSIIEDLITTSGLLQARSAPTPTNSYICWGEYGRILNDYLNFFPKKNILIIYYEDFLNRPTDVMVQILNFLKLETIDLVDTNRQYNVNDSNISLKSIAANFVFNERIRRLARFFFSKKIRRKVAFWSISNRKALNTDAALNAYIPPEQLRALASFYLKDAQILEDIVTDTIPWFDRYQDVLSEYEQY